MRRLIVRPAAESLKSMRAAGVKSFDDFEWNSDRKLFRPRRLGRGEEADTAGLELGHHDPSCPPRPFTSSATRSSLVRSAASALKLVTSRCRSTDGATAFTSSRSAIGRPSIAARALAPSTRYCDALGPAPHSTYSLTNAGACSSRRTSRGARGAEEHT